LAFVGRALYEGDYRTVIFSTINFYIYF